MKRNRRNAVRENENETVAMKRNRRNAVRENENETVAMLFAKTKTKLSQCCS